MLNCQLTDVGSAKLKGAAIQFMLSADHCFAPLFHSSVMKISKLRKGRLVSGRIENVTTFGAFCDIGVEENAYIPQHAYPRGGSVVVTW
uniref:S1 motif domain-containing protein n=1 Tax=Trichobilharzia regenti TaxID=157069 RepID=A0AA85JML4_TRIRE|nr:unnamed protein product [Trichobilharzia regenti]